ncbi:unnamed protein product [Protopolystoma xenopodis]|uniref:Uncharacterized protein n=1 Tax=Protopolystoma xenopodis TaxID=117903 RepID=A0A3S5CQ31_9PLAT|nr:unnamed protein product [Protopolystoma xenopodis]
MRNRMKTFTVLPCFIISAIHLIPDWERAKFFSFLELCLDFPLHLIYLVSQPGGHGAQDSSLCQSLCLSLGPVCTTFTPRTMVKSQPCTVPRFIRSGSTLFVTYHDISPLRPNHWLRGP